MAHNIGRGGFLWVVPLCLALSGCGGGAVEHKVSGKVNLDANPLAGADVTFEGPGGFAVRTDEKGDFAIASAAVIKPGQYKVKISRFVDKKGVVPSPEEYGQFLAAGVLRNSLPDAYSDVRTSGLTAEIKAGDNKLAFELSSKKKPGA